MGSDGTVLFAGGGTGGHLYPGISVALALKGICPEVRPLFLVTMREIDRVILEPTGFEFIGQPIVPPVKSISGLLAFWKSWRQTKDLVNDVMNKRRIAAVLGLGGYAAGVAVKIGARHLDRHYQSGRHSREGQSVSHEVLAGRVLSIRADARACVGSVPEPTEIHGMSGEAGDGHPARQD